MFRLIVTERCDIQIFPSSVLCGVKWFETTFPDYLLAPSSRVNSSKKKGSMFLDILTFEVGTDR